MFTKLIRAFHQKSGSFAAFFCLPFLMLASLQAQAFHGQASTLQALVTQATIQQLHQSPTWLALLHNDGHKSYIRDGSFLATWPDFSPAKELEKTLEILLQPNGVCRYPARYIFLRRNLDLPLLSYADCPEIKEFLERAPADKISLVFASENLAQPASMMGHVFIKLAGPDKAGIERQHAISFYTDTNTLNVPKLLFDSMVTGMKGYFSLSPFSDKAEQYVHDEGRALWEYQLNIDEDTRLLLRLHLIELKHANLTYYFQNYNCATVVFFILALTDQKLTLDQHWLTPKDVVRKAENAGIIGKRDVEIPDRWLVGILSTDISFKDKKLISHTIQGDQAWDEQLLQHINGDDLFYSLVDAYNNYLFQQKKISEERWRNNRLHLNGRHPDNEIPLEISTSLDPAQSPKESQIALAVLRKDNRTGIGLTMLPVSHYLQDDNRAYYSENELLMFETSMQIYEGKSPQIDRFTLYGIQALTPYSSLIGGLSGKFRIGMEEQYDNQLQTRRAAYISGALGLSGRPHKDMDIYGLVGAGLGQTRHEGYGYGTLEAGLLIREIFDMKTQLSLTRSYGQINTSSIYSEVRLTQSKYIDRQNTLLFEMRYRSNQHAYQHDAALIYKMLF